MANKNLFRRIAPIVMSAAVAVSGMPMTAMAEDFSDNEVIAVQEEEAETEEAAEETEDVDFSDDAEENSTEEAVDETIEITDEETTEEAQEESDVIGFNDGDVEFSAEAGSEQVEYVLMNIPYDDFYKAEMNNNSVKVDAFTSATLNKSRTVGMMNGNSAYHTDAKGTNLAGVTFPVKVTDASVLAKYKQITDSDSVTISVTNRGQTSSNTYTGKDALVESASYSYYVLSEAPTYYKELTVTDGAVSFGKIQGAAAQTVSTTASFTTKTTYGDYQLDIDSNTFSSVLSASTDTIYGAVVNTTDGTTYGLRHLENIWRGYALSWGVGYTTSVHNCPVSSDHYKSMVGKTIASVTYYTNKGLITFDFDDIKVPTIVAVSVGNVTDSATEAAVKFDQNVAAVSTAKYTVDGTEVTYADGKIKFAAPLSVGSHTLEITDATGDYAFLSTTFKVKTSTMPAKYDSENKKIVAADGASAEQLAAYIKNITKVKVGSTSYSATGRGSKTIVNTDGTLALDGLDVTSDTVFVVTSTGYKTLRFTLGEEKDTATYVLMNIPYDDFYKAELSNNSVKVDAFTSATKNKSRTVGMMNGNSAYHTDAEGTNLAGVTFPVKVADESVLAKYQEITDSDRVTISVTNRGKTTTTTYTGKNALVESANYSYYVLDEDATYYKELTVNADGSFSFGEIQGAASQTVETTADFTMETSYGDYELDINNDAFAGILDTATDTIYGAVVNTTEGTSYGLRHLENIWRGSMLSWGVGFTTSVHNCPVSADHYKSMVGKTITSVTYYTNKGLITFDFDDVYVPTILTTTASVADIADTAKEAAVSFSETLAFADTAKYTVDGAEVSYANGKITFASALSIGNHTLKISDTAGKYAAISTSFVVKASTMPAAYDSTNKKIVAANGASAEQLAAYIENITKVKVGETEYSATGRGAKIIVKEDGTLALEGLEVTDETEFVVTSEGYEDLSFEYTTQYVKLSASSATLYTATSGKTSTTLKVTTNSSKAASWKSSNTKVATVDKNGKVTAKAAGTATITVTVGNHSASCKVTVKTTGITVKASKTTIYTAGSKTSKITVTKNGVSGTAKFKSSNTKVAAVNSSGTVTAKKAGTVKITATVGKYSKTVTIKVKAPSLKLSKSSASIKKGKTTTIKATATPSGKITYTSSNKKVATVSSKGVVKGVKKGTATITVKCNGKTAKFKVTVK